VGIAIGKAPDAFTSASRHGSLDACCRPSASGRPSTVWSGVLVGAVSSRQATRWSRRPLAAPLSLRTAHAIAHPEHLQVIGYGVGCFSRRCCRRHRALRARSQGNRIWTKTADFDPLRRVCSVSDTLLFWSDSITRPTTRSFAIALRRPPAMTAGARNAVVQSEHMKLNTFNGDIIPVFHLHQRRPPLSVLTSRFL
jgi:hypothetical protein